jgi:hypothetical protein
MLSLIAKQPFQQEPSKENRFCELSVFMVINGPSFPDANVEHCKKYLSRSSIRISLVFHLSFVEEQAAHKKPCRVSPAVVAR